MLAQRQAKAIFLQDAVSRITLMLISGLRHARHIVALDALLARPSWRAVPLLILHGAAIGIMVFTETTLTAITLSLLTWALVNCFWLALLRRPAVAAALSLALVVGIVVLSRFKHDIVWMTIDFLDVMLIDFETITFLLTIFPNLQGTVAVLLVEAIILAVSLWRLDPHRVGRRAATLGLSVFCSGLIVLSIAAPGDWWEVFSKSNFISKFSRSAVAAIEELLTHGMLNADATAEGGLPMAQEGCCSSIAKLPHIILVHDESSFDIRVNQDDV